MHSMIPFSLLPLFRAPITDRPHPSTQAGPLIPFRRISAHISPSFLSPRLFCSSAKEAPPFLGCVDVPCYNLGWRRGCTARWTNDAFPPILAFFPLPCSSSSPFHLVPRETRKKEERKEEDGGDASYTQSHHNHSLLRTIPFLAPSSFSSAEEEDEEEAKLF